MSSYPGLHRGFTLVEMIIVIVITGIIGGMVAIFLRSPVQGYMDSSRRAEMTDIADTALRRLARDLHTAVPNSVRLPAPAGSSYVEFMPSRDGGRYRVNPAGGSGSCGAAGDDLDFTVADTCFEIIGSPITFNNGDAIVIGSTQSDGSLPYQAVTAANSVRRMIAAAGVGTNGFVKITSTMPFPASSELDGRRFEVVPFDQQAVTYACLNPGADANGDGTGTLTRYWAYGFNSNQASPPLAGTSAILADKVSACNFVYNTSNARNSLVAVSLTITRGGESVSLYQEIHMNNIP
ncbi:PulJ/GspJ family protein [Sideroxydans lithotrophicus]|uniref:MSHA biogenesis protein MshO n=1 Tax=Sideroxydans lithotrophicus (strain ES-1) TaxID=580332 RepID=D5CNC9_SIDLE|nr:prepilin-type N-terminal cleavage/methylation domain-containing protein [Sideroxydans lithotrophicus]ADE12826.1 conserved hypothetical protein [Sideroxydans lithotrophicus ES-1]